MIFNNKQNTRVKDVSGKGHWVSRSVVVVVMLVWKSHFLLVRRGPAVMQTGYYCMPCGYLDWDETVEECAFREVWEETGIDLSKYVNVKNIKPSYIISDPKASRKQDISFNFIIELNSEKQPEFDLDIVDKGETTDIQWVDISDISNYKIAFNHDKKILNYVNGSV